MGKLISQRYEKLRFGNFIVPNQKKDLRDGSLNDRNEFRLEISTMTINQK